jgi:molybdate transport system permease protein
VKQLGGALGGVLLLILAVPIAVLAFSASPSQIRMGIGDPMFLPAFWLSLRTTGVSLVLIVLSGTPVAWWLARSESRAARIVGLIVHLPIIMPPAVIGIALLQTIGRQGLLGPALDSMGVRIAFTEAAVVLAQVIIAAPFYVQAARNAFAAVRPAHLEAARALGDSRAGAVWRVALPIALPGLITGASLAWARALGEFGATLLFAGNLSGQTQTLPLAIFTALEADVRLAVVFAVVLAALGAVLLLGLRALARLRLPRTR